MEFKDTVKSTTMFSDLANKIKTIDKRILIGLISAVSALLIGAIIAAIVIGVKIHNKKQKMQLSLPNTPNTDSMPNEEDNPRQPQSGPNLRQPKPKVEPLLENSTPLSDQSSFSRQSSVSPNFSSQESTRDSSVSTHETQPTFLSQISNGAFRLKHVEKAQINDRSNAKNTKTTTQNTPDILNDNTKKAPRIKVRDRVKLLEVINTNNPTTTQSKH